MFGWRIAPNDPSAGFFRTMKFCFPHQLFWERNSRGSDKTIHNCFPCPAPCIVASQISNSGYLPPHYFSLHLRSIRDRASTTGVIQLIQLRNLFIWPQNVPFFFRDVLQWPFIRVCYSHRRVNELKALFALLYSYNLYFTFSTHHRPSFLQLSSV